MATRFDRPDGPADDYLPFSGRVLAVQRIILGALFMATTIENTGKGLYGATAYADFLRGWAQGNALPPYRAFLETVVIPQAGAFGAAQAVVEPIFGVLLLFGLFTRPAALLAFLFSLSLLFGAIGNEWPWTYILLVLLSASAGLTAAGRVWGLDGWLARRLPATLGPALRLVL